MTRDVVAWFGYGLFCCLVLAVCVGIARGSNRIADSISDCLPPARPQPAASARPEHLETRMPTRTLTPAKRLARTVLSTGVLVAAGYLAKVPSGHCRSCGTCICPRCQTGRRAAATTKTTGAR